MVAEKVAHALAAGLSVMPCIGENLKEKEAKKTDIVCFAQLAPIVGRLCLRPLLFGGENI